MLTMRWWSHQRYIYTAVCHHTKHGRERTRHRRVRWRRRTDMMWAIELEVDYAQWRELTDAGPDDKIERERWVKMCHRLGSTAAKDIVTARHGDRT